MNITIIKKLPKPEDIIQAFPLSDKGMEHVNRDKQEIKDILSGKDKRMLIIVGPCSAWPFDAVLEFAKRLKILSDKLRGQLKIVMRVYIQKPRTTKGWTGPVNQPNPFLLPNIEEGIAYCRSLMVKIIEMGLPIADEALFTHNAKGFIELLSWVAIGARSSEDQEHRIFASSIDCPVGIKNPTCGSIEKGINGIVAAQHGHTAVFNGFQVETHGNPFAHLVLRGGETGTNFHEINLIKAKQKLEKNNVSNPAIVVDASHDNCIFDGKKNSERQIDVAREVLKTLDSNPYMRDVVKGFMFESFIKPGAQKFEKLTAETIDMNGLSITDPCLGWETTEQLLIEIANGLKQIKS